MDLIPTELRSSTTCYAFFVHTSRKKDLSYVDEKLLGLCTSDGHLLEIKNGIISSSCNLQQRTATEMSIFRKYANGTCIIFYVVKCSTNELVIVQKQNRLLHIVKEFKNIEKFSISDFENLGYPQLKIWNFNTSSPLVTQLTAFKDDNISKDPETVNNSLLSGFLENNLQRMKRHLSELEKESASMTVMLNRLVGNYLPYEMLVDVGNERLAVTPKRNPVKPHFTITKTWQKTSGEFWILGIHFWNSGSSPLSDVQLIVFEDDIPETTHRLFSPGTTEEALGNFSAEKKPSPSLINPKQEGVAVVAFKIPQRSSCEVQPILHCQTWQERPPKFILTSQDIIRGAHQLFRTSEDNNFEQDLMCLLTLSIECTLVVTIPLDLGVSLNSIFEKEFGFEKIKSAYQNVYYKKRNFLENVVVSLKKISPKEWRIILLARDTEQVVLLVNALYDQLPTGTLILADEDKEEEAH